MTATRTDDKLGREVWIVAAVVTVGTVMSILDTTIVNVALETLSRELNASLSTIQWVSTGLAGIVFGLSETETHGGLGARIAWIPIVAGLVLIVLFVRHAWFADRPLIDVRLFRNTGFSAAAATTFLLGGSLFGTLIVLPLYYQIARGESALTAGLLLA